MNTKINHEALIDEMATKWPSTFVARSALAQFSGGAICGKTIANLESLGDGPANKFFIGGKACYPVASVIAFLKGRCKE